MLTEQNISDLDAILGYKRFLQKLDDMISNGPYKVEYICKQLGMSRITLYKKRKNNTFTLQEAEKLAKMFGKV